MVAVPAVAYLVVTAFVAFDAIVPAVPSEVFVVSAGALAAAGHLNVWWAGAAAALGAFAGDHAVYAVGRHKLPGVLDRSRFGRRVTRSVERTHARLGSATMAAVIAARFVPLGRTATTGAAGLAGMPLRRFSAASALGAPLWAAWMVGLGYITGSVADVPLWLQVGIGVGVGLLVGVWVAAVHAVIRTRRRMSARAAAVHLPTQPGPTSTEPAVAAGPQRRPDAPGSHVAGWSTQPANSTRPVARWVATKPNGRSYDTARPRAFKRGMDTTLTPMDVTAAASKPTALKIATAD